MRKHPNVRPKRTMPFPGATPADITRACQSLRQAYYRLLGRKRVNLAIAQAIRDAKGLARLGLCEQAADLLQDVIEELTSTLATGRQG